MQTLLGALTILVVINLSLPFTPGRASAWISKSLVAETHIEMHLIFFRLENEIADSDLSTFATQATQQIQMAWSSPLESQGARLKLSYEVLSGDAVLALAKNGEAQNPKNNFILVTKNNLLWSFVVGSLPGGNLAFFKLDDLHTKPLTFAHEAGHLLGLAHHEENLGTPMMRPLGPGEMFLRNVTPLEATNVLKNIRWNGEQGTLGHITQSLSELSPVQYPRHFRFILRFLSERP